MTKLRAGVAVFMVAFAIVCLVDSIKDSSGDLPPIPASTTPVYPLGHPPTNCAEYIATNTYNENC